MTWKPQVPTGRKALGTKESRRPHSSWPSTCPSVRRKNNSLWRKSSPIWVCFLAQFGACPTPHPKQVHGLLGRQFGFCQQPGRRAFGLKEAPGRPRRLRGLRGLRLQPSLGPGRNPPSDPTQAKCVFLPPQKEKEAKNVNDTNGSEPFPKCDVQSVWKKTAAYCFLGPSDPTPKSKWE